MSLNVVYTKNAIITADATYTFILNKFGTVIAEKFVVKVEKVIRLIAANPLMYKSSAVDETVRVA